MFIVTGVSPSIIDGGLLRISVPDDVIIFQNPDEFPGIPGDHISHKAPKMLYVIINALLHFRKIRCESWGRTGQRCRNMSLEILNYKQVTAKIEDKLDITYLDGILLWDTDLTFQDLRTEMITQRYQFICLFSCQIIVIVISKPHNILILSQIKHHTHTVEVVHEMSLVVV